MSETQQPKGTVTLKDVGRSSRIVNRVFKYIFFLVYILTFATMVYWFVASDRYVSESVVMVQNTDSSGSSQPTDLLNMFIGTAGNRSDQLILVEYLTSLDVRITVPQNMILYPECGARIFPLNGSTGILSAE